MTANLQVSKKLDDGTIVVVGAETKAELDTLLESVVGDTGRDEINSLFYKLLPSDDPTPAAVATVSRTFTNTTPAPAAPPAGGQLCEHGQVRVPKSGVSATGKPWNGLFCPLPKGQSCSPVWVR